MTPTLTVLAVQLYLLADTETLSPEAGMFAQYGVLGVFAALLIAFARVSYKRETNRSDRLEAEVTRLNTLIVDRVIPALTTAASSVEEATSLLREMQRDREVSLMREREMSARIRGSEDRR